MKRLLLISLYLSYFFSASAQSNDTTLFDSSLFKRNDTLFLKKTLMPFNGQLTQSKNIYQFYLNGILADSTFLDSGIWNYLVEMIFPFTKDTFLIDTRNKINHEIFKDNKIFFLKSSIYPAEHKSRIINIDTLQATEYSQIKIADEQFYDFYEKNKICPIGNHKDNLIPYLWGLPNKKGLKLAKKGKIILMGCIGSGEGGQMYYCKLHKIDI
jgi:hypothetical protein